MSSRFLINCVVLGVGLGAAAVPAAAWTPALEQSVFRDAQRLLPPSLALLLRNRESAVLDAARHPDAEVGGFAGELAAGRLEPRTLAAFDTQLRDALALMKNKQVGA